MSEIKQLVRWIRSDFRNASADENPFAVKPSNCRRPTIASRTDSSSSTTAIAGLVSIAKVSAMENAYLKNSRLAIALWCRLLRRIGIGLKFVGHPGQFHR